MADMFQKHEKEACVILLVSDGHKYTFVISASVSYYCITWYNFFVHSSGFGLSLMLTV